VSNIHNLSGRISNLKEKQAALDGKGEEEDLSEEELTKLHGISSDIHSLSRLNTSICWQQSRLCWLREGDAIQNSSILCWQVGGAGTLWVRLL